MQQVLKSYFEVNVYVVLFMRIYIKKKKKQQIHKNNDVNNMIFRRDVSAHLKGPIADQ